MKKTIAVIGSAAALSLSGAGIAAAQSELPFPIPGSSDPAAETPVDDTEAGEGADADDSKDGEGGEGADPETPEEVSQLAEQICGAVTTFDVLGSVGAIAPGLEGDDCAVTADEALTLAQEGDIQGAVDLLTGVEVDEPGDDDEEGHDETEAKGDVA